MHTFNRFYLLGATVFSLLVPLISVEREVSPIQQAELGRYISFAQPEQEAVPMLTSMEQQPVADPVNYLPLVLITVYGLVSSLLFFRFLRNLFSIRQKVLESKKLVFKGANLVLIPQEETPHTFMKFIFLNQQEYENGSVEKEVLYHELAHARQIHSIDVIWIELLQVFFWFNPFLIVYRRAIQLNHEFLADAAVLYTYQNIVDYQKLLLSKVMQRQSLGITSQFNYSVTKKRLIMMSNKTSLKQIWLTRLLVLPVLATGVILFCNAAPVMQEPVKQTSAQQVGKTNSNQILQQLPDQVKFPGVAGKQTKKNGKVRLFNFPYTKEGVSETEVGQYLEISKKYVKEYTDLKGVNMNISADDREKLIAIFKKMSIVQQNEQTIVFSMPSKPLPKSSPTVKQWQDFQDPKTYGVWIDDKKVANSVLAGHKPADFKQLFISRLSKTAKYSKSYKYQVDLMTNAYYRAYLKKQNETKDVPMTLFSVKPSQQLKKGLSAQSYPLSGNNKTFVGVVKG